jgi:hypothetical protein
MVEYMSIAMEAAAIVVKRLKVTDRKWVFGIQGQTGNAFFSASGNVPMSYARL